MEGVALKVMKSVTDRLKESDKMCLELEKKRMKSEQEQRREERQLQMMQMLIGFSHRLHVHVQIAIHNILLHSHLMVIHCHGDTADSS